MNVVGVDYSTNGTAMVFDSKERKRDYIFFSQYVRDKSNVRHFYVPSKGMTTFDKVDKVADVFKKIINRQKPDLVVSESASYGGSNKNDAYKDGYAIIRYLCRSYNIKIVEVTPLSLKTYMTGDSKADKCDMAEAVRDKYDIDYTKVTSVWDNLADAHSLYDLGCSYLSTNGVTSEIEKLPLYQQQTLYNLYGNSKEYKRVQRDRMKLKKKQNDELKKAKKAIIQTEVF